MRIGELLLTSGAITEQQLDEGLRAQVIWGGRLGTNLVELGYITLDDLSRALGRQHDLPAALDSHLARADRDLQQKLPAELAAKYECVPLVCAGKRIVIASIAPLDEVGVALVAGQLDINRMMIVQSIAAEMRMRFQLERAYGIPRGQRFMRTRGTTDQSQLFRIPELASPGREKRRTDGAALNPPIALDVDMAPAAPPRVHDPSVERRTYLRTLADVLSASIPTPVGDTHAIGSTKMPKIDLSVIASTLPEALSEIMLARDRDQLARRLVGTVARFVPESTSALLLVIRGAAAVSWMSFCRDGTTLPGLAVPLDHPGLVAAVTRRKVLARGASGDLAPIDYLLLTSLGVQFGDLVVTPLMIAGHVIGTIVLATKHRAGLASLDAIAAAGSAAFTRLMRDAALN